MAPIYRAASLTDADRIADIHRLSRARSMPWLPVLHTPEEDRWFFRHIILPDHDTEVCEVDGMIVGFIAISGGWLHHLYLETGFQGQGMGAGLLSRAQNRYKRLDLWVFQQNSRAIRFYETAGFREIARTDGQANEEKTPDMHMRWTRG